MRYIVYNILVTLIIIGFVGCTHDTETDGGNGGGISLSGSIDTRAAGDDYPFWLYAVETGIASWAGNVIINTPDAVLNGNQVTLPQTVVQPFLFKNVDWIGLMREGDINKTYSTLPQAPANGKIDLEPGEGTNHSYLLACVKDASPRQAELPFEYLMSQVLVTFKLSGDIELSSTETSLPVEYTLKSPKLTCDLLNNTQAPVSQGTVDIAGQANAFKTDVDNVQKFFYLTPGTSLVFEDIIINGSSATRYDTGITTLAGKSYTVELTVIRRNVESVKVTMTDWLPGYDIEQPPLYTQIQFAGWQPVGDTDINKTLSQRITRVEFVDDNTGNKVTAAVKKDGLKNMRLEGYELIHNNISSLCIYLDGVKVDVDRWVDRQTLPDVIRINKKVTDVDFNHILVANRKDLEEIILNEDNNIYYQITDIDLSDADWIPIGFHESNPDYFDGYYDGQGFCIKNMKIDMPQNNYLGLFSKVGRNISNLTLESADITGGSFVGSICGSTENEPLFANIHITSGSKITGTDNVGGICGKAEFSIFESCSNASDIKGESLTGGIVGYRNLGQMHSCLNTGHIHCIGDNGGGIAGECIDGDFYYCANRGIITGEGNNYGGIAGAIDGSGNLPGFFGCYNSGDVSPDRQLTTVGAIIGYLSTGLGISQITNCYWAGNISQRSGSMVGSGTSWNSNDTYPFSIFNWPEIPTTHWGLFLGPNTGPWKSLGRWDSTYPIYPVLWFE